jgi:hypothetical protein
MHQQTEVGAMPACAGMRDNLIESLVTSAARQFPFMRRALGDRATLGPFLAGSLVGDMSSGEVHGGPRGKTCREMESIARLRKFIFAAISGSIFCHHVSSLVCRARVSSSFSLLERPQQINRLSLKALVDA